ncbi:MAG: hypothetical protein HY903_25205 [Deltaproteobacteria bacterium]|nr:hypothetical protein [Deltaproteobacteria bacterium]
MVLRGSASAWLSELERLKTDFTAGRSDRKLALLAALADARLPTARQVHRLHEALCFMRAYPDDARILRTVERLLHQFADRRDLRRHRRALANSGIAGTSIHFPFFSPAAVWLTTTWPDALRFDRRRLRGADGLAPYLERLALFAETMGLDELPLSVTEWIDAMRGPQETDAGFVARAFHHIDAEPRLLEALYDDLDLPCVLSPGPDTPARGRLKLDFLPVRWQTRPLRRERPDLAVEIRKPPHRVQRASRVEARRVIKLARSMMVCMERDLDVFSYASDADVCFADCGAGLCFAFIGFVPERRLMLEALYGYVALQNGVALGYGTVASLFGTAELAFNMAATFRGGETAHVFGRLCACARALFGADSFSLTPYQIGDDNPEAVKSGAWWFYQKLGFRPQSAALLRLMRRELRAMRRDPGHRSAPATLKELATESVYFHLGRRRDDVLGLVPIGNVGLQLTRFLAERYGAERRQGVAELVRHAARLLAVRSLAPLGRDERLAFARFAPLVCLLPGIERWSAKERGAFFEVVRAKGGRSELEYARRFDAHAKLRRALVTLAARGPDPGARGRGAL